MSSLKSKLRGNLLKSHGERKNSRNHIWLSYSFKKGGDITLASNNECIYWASELESNPDIKDFLFGVEVVIQYPWEETARKREVILTETRTGATEFHQLVSGMKGERREMVAVFENGSNTSEVATNFFDTKNLASAATRSVHWLKILSFAAQIRDELCLAETNWVNLFLRTNRTGDVRQLLISSTVYDPMIILGVFARVALQGDIGLEFVSNVFGRNTRWTLRGD
ncbi:hypothetical protein J3P88_16605 [Pseudomonas sp. Z3-6]|uniref:hypothetical protein n=1 Tax=Pseudomonas sp. Z3-6 TaxID=2817411 RepID=UPI003DA925F3